MMNKTLLLGASAAALLASPALAAETIVVPFNVVSTATTQQYSRNVQITVSGTGFSNANNINDAFYNLPDGSTDPDGYYQLGFSTSPLFAYDNSKAAVKALGTRPTLSATGTYTFRLNVGTTPTNLYFGVTDGQFGDNGGAFTVSVAGVPEPATWSLLIVGFGAVGFAMRRRQAPAFA